MKRYNIIKGNVSDYFKLEAYYKSLISVNILDPNGEHYDYSEEGRESFFDGMELHEIITK